MNVTPNPIDYPFRGSRIEALDGLRGVAILMVLLAHFYLGSEQVVALHYPVLGGILSKVLLSGVWGVELFFVLSGFLITGILIDSKGQSGYLRKFYMRRALRIIPLYYISLGIVFYVLPTFVDFDEGALNISRRQGWLWSYL